MRIRDLLPFALVGGIGVFIVMQRQSLEPSAARPAAASPEPPAASVTTETPPAVVVEMSARPARAPLSSRDSADLRLRLEQGAPGTYIHDILAQQEQLLARWPSRDVDAMRVWIERWSAVSNWDRSYPLVAEAAFGEWRDAGFPMRFDFVTDSSGADIKIIWSNKFADGGRQIGVTLKMRDQDGWIVRCEIIIATHDSRGQPLAAATIAGVARHEVGHALGLGHSPSKADVMYPESYATVISSADRATLHLLYALPPGKYLTAESRE